MNRDDWKAIILVFIIVVAATAAALYAISVTRKGIDGVFWSSDNSPTPDYSQGKIYYPNNTAPAPKPPSQ